MSDNPELRVTFPGGKRVAATYQGHTILTDQPVASGGEDSAPSPYNLFLASIGTCAGIFVVGFCQNRGLPTDGIDIRQTMDVDPVSHVLRGVDLDIRVPPSFPEKYREALVRVAEQCTVKRTIAAQPEFHVRTVVTGDAAVAVA